jgi:hypothetical protein
MKGQEEIAEIKLLTGNGICFNFKKYTSGNNQRSLLQVVRGKKLLTQLCRVDRG